MASLPKRPSPVTLKSSFPSIAERFAALRAEIVTAAGCEPKLQELMLLSGFLISRQASGFKVHAKRALEYGATEAEVRAAVVVNLGATASIELVADALHWVDELIADRS
jgi:alkylhydroperoxidase/carboxymuconolactone decarboxylase family protein YurZ